MVVLDERIGEIKMLCKISSLFFGNENDYRMIARLDDVVFSRREGDEGGATCCDLSKAQKRLEIYF